MTALVLDRYPPRRCLQLWPVGHRAYGRPSSLLRCLRTRRGHSSRRPLQRGLVENDAGEGRLLNVTLQVPLQGELRVRIPAMILIVMTPETEEPSSLLRCLRTRRGHSSRRPLQRGLVENDAGEGRLLNVTLQVPLQGELRVRIPAMILIVIPETEEYFLQHGMLRRFKPGIEVPLRGDVGHAPLFPDALTRFVCTIYQADSAVASTHKRKKQPSVSSTGLALSIWKG